MPDSYVQVPRVWSDLDMRLLMADLHAKLTLAPR